MSICPNKKLAVWDNLINGLKKTFLAEGKDYAEIAFHRYGDIPTAEVAYKYINNKINKEEAQFDKWANYTKGQLITNQGELSLDDFKTKFNERFNVSIDTEQAKKFTKKGRLDITSTKRLTN